MSYGLRGHSSEVKTGAANRAVLWVDDWQASVLIYDDIGAIIVFYATQIIL